MKKIFKVTVWFLMITALVLCASAVVSAEDYDLWVGGIRVTSDNASDIFGDGKAVFDAETNTLILDTVTLTAYYDFSNPVNNKPETAAIYSLQELNILVKGNCSLYTSAKNSYNDYGIYCKRPTAQNCEMRDALTITGYDDEAKLTVSSASTLNETSALYTFDADIRIQDIGLTCYSASAMQSNTIYANGGEIFIDNSVVTCNAAEAQTQSSGLLAGFGINISGASNVTFTSKGCSYSGVEEVASYGALTLGKIIICEESSLSVNAATINCSGTAASCGASALLGVEVSDNSKLEAYGGTVTSTDSSAQNNSIGVFSSNVLVTDDSEVIGHGMYSSYMSAGIYGHTITVEDGDVVGYANSGVPLYSAIASDNPIQGDDASIYDSETKYYLDFVPGSDGLPGYFVDETGEITKNAIVTSSMEFDIWVGSVQVTSENAHDVLGDGTVSYDHATRTLTLDNAVIKETHTVLENLYSSTDENGVVHETIEKYTAGIYSNMPITLNIVGDVVIDCSDDTSHGNYGIKFDCSWAYDDYTNTIVGNEDSSLTVNAGGTNISYGIWTSDAICVIKDLDINVTAGDTCKTSVGIFLEDADEDFYIEIDNCNVVVCGGNISGDVEEMGAVGIGGGSVYIRNGSDVTALSGDVTSGTENSSCAGFFCLGFVEVSGGSTLTAKGGNVYANSGEINTLGMVVVGLLTIDDNCSVVATAGDARYNGEEQENARSIGFTLSLADAIIGDNASLTATGGYSDGTSMGIYVESIDSVTGYSKTIVLETEDSVVVAGTNNTNTDALNVGIYAETPIQNGTVKNFDTHEVLVYNDCFYTDSEGNIVANTIVNGGDILFGDYNLVVGGIEVTVFNKDDILGELDGDGASAYYDPDTKTLTLENAVITTYYDMGQAYVGILRAGALNINLVGDNKVVVNSYDELPEIVAGIATFNDVTINSEKSARLEIVTGDTTGDCYGIYTTPSDDGSFIADITVCGRATVIARSGNINYEYEHYTAGVTANGSVNVLDSASLYCYAGKAVYASEGSNYAYGVSAGIISYNVMNINTTGTVYGYGEKSDFVMGGLGGFSGINLINGVVIGECGSDVPVNAIAAGVVFAAEPQNVIVKTGSAEDTAGDDHSWINLAEGVGGTYLDGTGVPGKYTMLLPVKGICGIETETDQELGDAVTVKSIDADENVFVAFASYDANGRMIDYKTTFASNADDDNELSVALNLEGAVKVRVFVFENNSSFSPISDYIEKVYFDTIA